MQDSIETLVCFLELLEIQPPILQEQDKSSLTRLLEELEPLNLDEIQQAANSIREWCENHEKQLKEYDKAKRKERKELDEIIDSDPHKDRWIIPNFQLETSEYSLSENSDSEVRILITPPPESSETCPVKVPILDYVKQILSQWINR
ncbi:hypothetical protein [Planktothrix sp. FACHB-1365]|uniref:hypothetical protein n=1 Tax=Planktothrix sp. FACHB-1365 TaxID=2692855 RepID=UPI0016841610|nr:hypothetical protein [Planktothrix sp. FACHB-1365]MBD2483686.1 hypothetical protein [Planktothrix sp. FACHB-1365]